MKEISFTAFPLFRQLALSFFVVDDSKSSRFSDLLGHIKVHPHGFCHMGVTAQGYVLTAQFGIARIKFRQGLYCTGHGKAPRIDFNALIEADEVLHDLVPQISMLAVMEVLIFIGPVAADIVDVTIGVKVRILFEAFEGILKIVPHGLIFGNAS